MKRLLVSAFAAVFLVTFAALVVLDGPSGKRSTPVTGQEPPPAPVATVAPDPAAVAGALDAYRLLLSLQVDRPTPEVLISGGLAGALSFVRGHASPAPSPLPTTEVALEAAFSRLLSENPRVQPAELTFAFIEGMVDALQERHTAFLRPDSWANLKDNQRPYLGYSSTTVADGRLVWQVDAGSPAAAAGLRPGDTILSVNGKQLANSNIAAVIGRTDTLLVRGVDGRQRTTTLTPGYVVSPIESRVLTGGIAYLRITSFVPPGSNDNFIAQLDTAMRELIDARPSGWILDLRSNGGGVVTLANYTAGWLGYSGTFAEVSGRDDARRVRPYVAERKASLGSVPLVILVNRRSASSSEMLAETLRAAGIARIVGEPTAGSVRLAQYHEVAGGALQIAFADVSVGPNLTRLDKVGITPDETIYLSPGELARGFDAQLDRAISLIAGE